MSQFIDFGEGHTTVVGMTRSGKTFAVEKSIERIKQGVLFFNTQHIPVSSKFIDINGKDDTSAIVRALRAGEKLNFIPTRETRWKQEVGLIKLLYHETEKSKLDIYFVADECHLADKDAKKSLIELATTGISWGLKAVFISQRPALIDNTLMTQSNQFVFLKTTMEKSYLEGYEIPYDEIKSGLDRGGQYAFMVYDFTSVRGPFKV